MKPQSALGISPGKLFGWFCLTKNKWKSGSKRSFISLNSFMTSLGSSRIIGKARGTIVFTIASSKL